MYVYILLVFEETRVVYPLVAMDILCALPHWLGRENPNQRMSTEIIRLCATALDRVPYSQRSLIPVTRRQTCG